MQPNQLIKVFKALGEPTRFKIIKILSLQSMCVCELREVLDMLQPRISQHLKILKDAGLVEERREGYFSYYSLIKSSKLNKIWESFILYLDVDLKDIQGFEAITRRYAQLPCSERVKRVKETIIKMKEENK